MARAYEYITKFTSPNQNARNSKVKSITIHHWGSRGQKFDNVVNWLCQKRAGTSAHYVVEAGKVACIVDPDRRAWHAGNSRGNHESIGIECRPEATEGDYRSEERRVGKECRSRWSPYPSAHPPRASPARKASGQAQTRHP